MKTFISNCFSQQLKEYEFKKSGQEYFRSLQDVWQIVSLTKDFSWGSRYSASFGVFVKQVEKLERCPRERFSHIRCGVHKLLHAEGDAFRYNVMDLSVDMDDKLREGSIKQLVRVAVNDFFDSCQSVSRIEDALQKGYFSDVLFHRDLRDFLEKSK